MIIVLEGIDGSGKTTLAGRLRDRLRTVPNMPPIHLFRDPGGTPVGEKLRAVVKDGKLPMHPVAQMLTFSAARTELAEVVRPLDKDGAICILDRWWFSTWAYQSTQQVSPVLIEHIAKQTAHLPLTPALSFWFDVDPKTAMERMAAREQAPGTQDRFDSQGLRFRKSLVACYNVLRNRKLLTRIDANPEIDVVWTKLLEHVSAGLDIKL